MTSTEDTHAHHAEQTRRLRRLGLRATPQRVLVLEALAAQPGHLSADEILRWVAERYPAINLATVYRTLDTLASAGLVTQTNLGEGVMSYELVGENGHHHLICQRCRGVAETSDVLFAPVREALLRDFGFRATSTHFAIFGVCKVCAQASTPQWPDRTPPAQE